MLPKLTTSIVALTIAFHAVVGCCIHHGHPHDHAQCQTQVLAEAGHGNCEHAHHEREMLIEHTLVESHGSHVPGDGSHHQHKPCNESDCQFVSNSRVNLANWVPLELCSPLWTGEFTNRSRMHDFDLTHFLICRSSASAGSRSAPTYSLNQAWLL